LEKKPVELLSMPKEAWWVCFLQSRRKKWKNGFRKKPVEFLPSLKKTPWVCFF
jgi:hypothetical protein